jgi:hypothetical protein
MPQRAAHTQRPDRLLPHGGTWRRYVRRSTIGISMSTQSNESQPSSSQTALSAAPGTYRAKTWHDSSGLHVELHICRGSSFWDSTPGQGLELSLTSDGSGLTLSMVSCTAESPAPPTAKPSDDLPSSSDGRSPFTSPDGIEWTWNDFLKIWERSSNTTAPKSQSSEEAGLQRWRDRVSELHPTTSGAPEPQSSCHED